MALQRSGAGGTDEVGVAGDVGGDVVGVNVHLVEVCSLVSGDLAHAVQLQREKYIYVYTDELTVHLSSLIPHSNHMTSNK